MATDYPTSQDGNDTLPDPTSSEYTNSPSHAGLHTNANDAIKAIEGKLGNGVSTPGANGQLLCVVNGATIWQTYSVGGDLVGSLPNPSLAGSGVTPGTYGSNTQTPVITVDGKGRITSASVVNTAGGGGGSSSPLTTKGDIWVYSTSDTRLPVGTNGYILSADSTQTTGLKWISAPTSAVWGSITGTLSSQTDLQTALNAKAANGANSDITSLSGLTTPLSVAQGGTGQGSTSITAKEFFASPNGASGSPVFRAIVASDVPTLNQNTTGSAATLTTPRNLGVLLSSSSSVTFDGSANQTSIPVSGILSVSNGGTGVSLASTGGTSQVLKQTSSGGNITVAQLAASDLSNGTTGSGNVVLATSPVITTGTVAADPTTALGIADKQYVDNLGTGTLIQNETPGGSINGSNTAFTTASVFNSGSLRVYLNGQRLTSGSGNDYVEGTQAFTMQYAPATGDVMLVDYNVTNTKFIQGSNSIVVNENPTGTINGSNTSFTTQLGKYVANTLEVFINGVGQIRGTDYTETTPSSGTFTMTTAPATGQVMRINYQFSTGAAGNAQTVNGINASTTATANDLYPLNGNAQFPASVIGGLVVQRQGGTTGAANSWLTPGTSNTSLSSTAVTIQVGSIQLSGTSGTDVTVTFPQSFTQVPIVVATVASANSVNESAAVNTITASSFKARCIVTGGSGETCTWIAIGV